MEDCCAVCAEPLEWIAYGPCGHREVCSTCTARLRVVLDDKRCCICKQEASAVYITRALGDYTKVISDFNTLPATRGLWFESDIGAYFDDEDEFKRIKAMCRLQCKLCENAGASDSPPVSGAVRRGFIFRNLELLRRHIFGAHKLIMCSLCLEGRKVFIQDQKLYTKAQLERHSSKGDSQVDGNEEERGGFNGHPMCAFCTKRFYSENELYHHMSTEHFTCHLCQRSRPGQFEYYQHYDDLESHFRNEHSLCEDPECLAKKFIVFISESELKVHTAKEHGGSLTRAQRNAALKIPVSYHFRRPESRRGGSVPRGSRGNDLNTELLSSSEAPAPEDAAAARNPENFPALAAPSEPPSAPGSSSEAARWVSAIHGVSQSTLSSESAFPPLPGAPAHPQQQPMPRQASHRPLASLLAGNKGKGKVKVLNSAERKKQQEPGAPAWTPLPEPRVAASAASYRPSDYPELRGPRPSPGGGTVAASSSSASSSAIGTTPGPGPASISLAATSLGKLSMDEIRAATKALQEKIRSHLGGDEVRFAAFREVQSQFKKGEVSVELYCERVGRLGLREIIPELARLCPDESKQQELLEVIKRRGSVSNGYKEKGLGKEERRIHKPAEEEVEVLSSEGYRSLRKGSGGSSSKPPDESWSCGKCTLLNPERSSECSACGVGKNGELPVMKGDEDGVKEKKKKKGKVSKFIRNRLGEIEDGAAGEARASAAAAAAAGAGATSSSEGVIRGAWKNNGGQKLVAMSSWGRGSG